MIIDWQEEQERVVYPAGTYKVVISEWESGESSEKKTPYIMFKAKIVDPELHRGRGIVDFCHITEKAIWRLKKFVSAAGVDAKPLGKTDTTSPQFKQIIDSVKGRKMFWLVGEDTDPNGMPRNVITDYVNDLDQEPAQVGDKTPEINWND